MPSCSSSASHKYYAHLRHLITILFLLLSIIIIVFPPFITLKTPTSRKFTSRKPKPGKNYLKDLGMQVKVEYDTSGAGCPRYTAVIKFTVENGEKAYVTIRSEEVVLPASQGRVDPAPPQYTDLSGNLSAYSSAASNQFSNSQPADSTNHGLPQNQWTRN